MNKKNIIITIISVLILTCIFAFARTTTTDLGLVKPTWSEDIDILDDLNSNSDILEAFANDPLEFDTGERIEDRVGAMFSGNTETGLTLTYQDADNTIDVVIGADDIVETMLKFVNLPNDEEIFTYESTTGDFEWHTLAELSIQPLDAGLTSIAGLTTAANKSIYTTALDTYAVYDLTAFARTILDDAAATNVRDTLGLTIGTNVQAYDDALASISGLTYASPSFIKVTAEDTYAIRTITETKTDLSLNNVTNDAQIAKSIGTAQGDLIYFTGSATPTVLAKGAATEVLTMNAGATAPEWAAAGGGYTNLTEFIAQTAWRLFYSNTDGDVTELALGADGTYLKSGGAAVAPTWETPAGSGTVTTSGTPVDDDYAKFTAATVIEGRSHAEMLQDLNPVTTSSSENTLTVAEAGLILVSDAHTETLPTASGNMGLTYTFLKTDWDYDLITLEGDGAETFNYENSTGSPNLTYLRLNTPCAEVTIVSDGTNWQVINEVMGQVPECRVHLSGNQLNITNATFTLIELDTEDYDIGSNFNTTTHLFTCPIAGTYEVVGNISYTAVVVDKRYYVNLYENEAVQSQICSHSSNTNNVNIIDTTKIKSVATDTLSLYAYTDAGVDTVDVAGGVTYFSYLQIRLISKD